mmetsp:Transcript_32312/g.78645  ORF Transcript_32312/g.78645 Transcript_32312/m.78645 type:complete len:355 (-) Transcript_32312:282-1346(-)
MSGKGQHCSSARTILRGIQPLYVLLFAATCYTVFFIMEILPGLAPLRATDVLTADFWIGESQGSARRAFLVAAFFHTLLVLFLYSFRKAATTSPGRIPLKNASDLSKWRDGQFQVGAHAERSIKEMVSNLTAAISAEFRALVRGMVVVERKKKLGLHRFCSFCTLYKPDRTHHCRICGKCTLRMDHHCPWLNNCVGYANYKYFVLTLLYALSLCAFMVVEMGPTVGQIVVRFPDGLEFLPVAVVYACLCLLAPLLLCFFGFHIYMTMNAMTTIEYREKKSSTDPYVQRRFEIAHLKYDKGYLRNLCHMFGPVHMWLVPSFDGNEGTYDVKPLKNKTVETGDAEGKLQRTKNSRV